jgi:hypothetical protein
VSAKIESKIDNIDTKIIVYSKYVIGKFLIPLNNIPIVAATSIKNTDAYCDKLPSFSSLENISKKRDPDIISLCLDFQ